MTPHTSSLVHRQLIGQNSPNLAEGRHLDAIFVQLPLHVVDLLLCKRDETPQKPVTCDTVNPASKLAVTPNHKRNITCKFDLATEVMDLWGQAKTEQIEAKGKDKAMSKHLPVRNTLGTRYIVWEILYSGHDPD